MAGSYDQIREEMIRLLAAGKYKVNDRLPSEPEMAERFNVSRMTYRNVVKSLVKEGRLYVRHGAGTFVANPLPSIESSLVRLESTGQMIRNAGFREDERQESLTVVTGDQVPEVCHYFRLTTDVKFVKLERYRIADDEPVSYSVNYLSWDKFGCVFEKYSFSGSLFKFLEVNAATEIACSDSELFAVPVSDPKMEKFKNHGKNGVMLLKQLHYNIAREPVLLSYDYLRNDIFNFRIRRWKK